MTECVSCECPVDNFEVANARQLHSRCQNCHERYQKGHFCPECDKVSKTGGLPSTGVAIQRYHTLLGRCGPHRQPFVVIECDSVSPGGLVHVKRGG